MNTAGVVNSAIDASGLELAKAIFTPEHNKAAPKMISKQGVYIVKRIFKKRLRIGQSK